MRVTPCRGNPRERTPPFKYMCFLACQSLHRIAAPRHSTQKRRPHTTGTTQKRLSVYGETFATSQTGASAHVVRKAQAPCSNVAGMTHDHVEIDCTGAASFGRHASDAHGSAPPSTDPATVSLRPHQAAR
ncbi:hypothetical protein XFF6166_10248 [Xanthomonas citri pv. fuscans]|nr:hypothetical protein XFF6166_10248 [Xanthomonas citri pv. fuscans]SOO02143.1 hypothetical protein XFF6960_580060 [Xanthomonas citri pv. fuscans]SOO06840.1 hypothetical protein XFF7767_80250 [Xanthomonas citri pv. fuscans]SOO16394.1 hypothetical protein XFF7766_770248 [Xanthomonas citri pv. fuscans]SOO45723.1 hypothetical protein XFF1815_900062 [Xanthomonas citri pv. fuscans]